MAVAPETDIVIDGETFHLVSIPSAESRLVQGAKDSLLGTLDLQSLVEDLGKLGNFILVAYNGVTGCTEVQSKVQRVGYKISELADKSAVTVHTFKGASQRVLQELKGTYQYLLDGLEEMALDTISQLTTIAKDMAAAADTLHCHFEQATEDVTDVLEDIQRKKGSQEKRTKALEEERKEFEMKQKMAVQQQKNVLESEEKAQALYNEAQNREDKAMDDQSGFLKTLTDVVTGITGAVASAVKLDVHKALDKIANIGDNSAYKEAMKMANREKKKQLEELQKQRDRGQEAIVINAVVFWQQMQIYCESLAKGDMQQSTEMAMKFDEEKRLKIWTSKGFKTMALQYYSRWVALDDVCDVYIQQIKDTRQDLAVSTLTSLRFLSDPL